MTKKAPLPREVDWSDWIKAKAKKLRITEDYLVRNLPKIKEGTEVLMELKEITKQLKKEAKK